ncbi:MAG: F0F1 ATP synthase subunit A [Candidatus Krumholzibacteriia bacterium]
MLEHSGLRRLSDPCAIATLTLAAAALVLLLAGAPAAAQSGAGHGDLVAAAPAQAASAQAASAQAAPAHAAQPPADPPVHGDVADSAHIVGEEAHELGHGEHGEEGVAGAHGYHGEDHGGHGGMPHLLNIVGLVATNLTDEQGRPTAAAHFLEAFVDPIFSLITAALVAIFFIRLRANLDPRDPTRLQVLAEILLGWLYGIFRQIIGPTAYRYTPYLGTLFIFILCNNLIGMLPLGHSSTASFQNTTLALGLATFFYVQGIAIKENGILGYLHHMAGSPKAPMDWGFSLLLFPLHVLGELIKPISLSLRLFGNIFGEHTLVATMVILGYLLVHTIVGADFVVGLPVQFPFYFLGLLSSTIQALVFTLLSTVYIALMLPHGDPHLEEIGH